MGGNAGRGDGVHKHVAERWAEEVAKMASAELEWATLATAVWRSDTEDHPAVMGSARV